MTATQINLNERILETTQNCYVFVNVYCLQQVFENVVQYAVYTRSGEPVVVGQMRPARIFIQPTCGWKEAKPVLVFRDENPKIRDRF